MSQTTVHLVGSVPLPDETAVFETVTEILGDRVERISDGETGPRFMWIGWQQHVFESTPQLERVEAAEAWDELAEEYAQQQGSGEMPPSFRLREGMSAADVAFPNLGYADAAIASAIGQLEARLPKIAAMLEEAEDDVLAFYAFPAEHWSKLRSTNPLERFNREIGRRTDVVGIFPDDASLIRLISMLAIEANDEWLVGRSYITKQSMATVLSAPKEQPLTMTIEDQEVPELVAA